MLTWFSISSRLWFKLSRLIVALAKITTEFDNYKTVVHIFNFDKIQWIKEQILDNQRSLQNLYLLQINGVIHILSHHETILSWRMSRNYTFIQEDAWLRKEILMKSKQLSVIVLDRNIAQRHLNNWSPKMCSQLLKSLHTYVFLMNEMKTFVLIFITSIINWTRLVQPVEYYNLQLIQNACYDYCYNRLSYNCCGNQMFRHSQNFCKTSLCRI